MLAPASRLRWLLLAAALLAHAPTVLATNACLAAAHSGGMGGTGAPLAKSTPAAVDEVGVGGTGATAASGGSGGTGSPAASGGSGGTDATAESGGSGGTGVTADAASAASTAIIGTVTGFASVCVNGLEVHFDPTTPTTINGVPGHPSRLAIGHVIAIEAAPSPRGLQARSIAIMYAVAGPVTAVDAARGTLQVMGQTVHPASQATIAVGPGTARGTASMRPGETVQVSGLRNARGEIVASRIEPAPAGSEASVIGVVSGANANRLAVHGTGLALTGADAGNVQRGREILARGKWDGTRLRAERIDRAASELVTERAERFSVEGYARRVGDRVQLGALPIQIDAGARTTTRPAQDQRVIANGRFTADRRAIVDGIETRRDGPNREGGRGRDAERSGGNDQRDAGGHGGGRDGGDGDRREADQSGGRESSSRGGDSDARPSDRESGSRGGADDRSTRDSGRDNSGGRTERSIREDRGSHGGRGR